MKLKNIHIIQLLSALIVSFIFAYIEYKLNFKSFWLMAIFFATSFIIGTILEHYFKKKLFRNAVQDFIGSLKEIREEHNLTPISTQSIMCQVTKNFIDLVDVNLKASELEIKQAGMHFCKTCNDTNPHTTFKDGKCRNCQIGLKFWTKMEAKTNK